MKGINQMNINEFGDKINEEKERKKREGGNRGFGDQFDSIPVNAKYRIVGVDTFDGTDWYEDSNDTLDQIKKELIKKTKNISMLIYHVYDKDGDHVFQVGKF